MEVRFYNFTCDPKQVDKTNYLVDQINKDCSVKADLSIETPTIELDFSAALANRTYCYIPELQRFYFISDRSLTTGHRLVISCQEDYLMSFHSQITEADALITRNEIVGINDIPDSKLPMKPANLVQTLAIPNSVINEGYDTTRVFVLQVLGGVD